MTAIKKPPRTQYFNCLTDGNPASDKPGRYLAKPAGRSRPVFRWWNGAEWQYNKNKKGVASGFGKRPGDAWAGASECHPLVAKELNGAKSVADTALTVARSLTQNRRRTDMLNASPGW